MDTMVATLPTEHLEYTHNCFLISMRRDTARTAQRQGIAKIAVPSLERDLVVHVLATFEGKENIKPDSKANVSDERWHDAQSSEHESASCRQSGERADDHCDLRSGKHTHVYTGSENTPAVKIAYRYHQLFNV